jgi:transposase
VITGGRPTGGIWLATAPADMRMSYDGLSALVRNRLGRDPTSGAWYVFVNRRRNMMKVLAFDRGGYWIWSKRLEQGRFAGDTRSGPAAPLSQFGLVALLEGIDVLSARHRRRYRAPGEARAA